MKNYSKIAILGITMVLGTPQMEATWLDDIRSLYKRTYELCSEFYKTGKFVVCYQIHGIKNLDPAVLLPYGILGFKYRNSIATFLLNHKEATGVIALVTFFGYQWYQQYDAKTTLIIDLQNQSEDSKFKNISDNDKTDLENQIKSLTEEYQELIYQRLQQKGDNAKERELNLQIRNLKSQLSALQSHDHEVDE